MDHPTTSKPRRLALPWRTHILLVCAVAGTFALLQLTARVWGYSIEQWAEYGWPGMWYREKTFPTWDEGLNDWDHSTRTVEVVPVGILLNLASFADVWLLLALSAEMVAARRFSLAGLFALMFLVAVLLGLILGAGAMSGSQVRW